MWKYNTLSALTPGLNRKYTSLFLGSVTGKLIFMSNISPYVYRKTIPFGDTDAAAIVYTPRFSDYCMEAAECWFRDYIDFDWYYVNTCLGMGTPVVHMHIDFVAPLKGGDKLGVVVRVAKFGRSSLTLDFEGLRESDDGGQYHCFSGRFVFCFTSAKTGTSVPVPEQQREFIRSYCAAC